MAEQLKNTLPFDLDGGESIVIPHELQTSLGTPLAPDIIFVPSAELIVTSDDVAVTLSNPGTTEISGALLVESWHTIERAFGDKANIDLPIKPYIVVTEGAEDAAFLNPMSPPEQWTLQEVGPGTTTQMDPTVSPNYPDIAMIRAGSIVGVRARVINTLLPGTGSIAVTPTINGVAVVGLTATIVAGFDGAGAIAAPGVIPYVAGDRIGCQATSALTFQGGGVDGWLEVLESI